MNSKKVFYVMTGLVSLASMAVIAGVVLGSSQLKQTAEQLMEHKLEARLLDEQQIGLIKAKKDIEANQELEQIAKTVVPQEKDQARTVREIINLADASGVKISSVTFPSSNLGQSSPLATPSTPTDGSTPSTPAAPSITQAKPVPGIPGVLQLEISVRSDPGRPVSYERFIEFLERLEQNRRTAHVTSINVKPDTKINDAVTFDLVINVFIKP